MLTPEKWRHISEIFHQVLDLAPDRRADWIASIDDEEIAREVKSLLASDEAPDRLSVEGRVKNAVIAFNQEEVAVTSRRAGPYRLGKELGRGGMGTVYLAERDDEQYQSQVAVKLVRVGMDTDFILNRFRRERQILAHMHHPNIAHLIDGGATEEGLPYIVMEYVKGPNIVAYCTTHRLSFEARIRLFLSVCAAVEHAHRRFVIHRDLKPGNILVDEAGEPKLLDFGISKLLLSGPVPSLETLQDGRLLTPDYASPEQVRGESISLQTDIYSLGAILYELLTGTKAHRIESCTPTALERAICEQDVVAPSRVVEPKALSRKLAGDLDNILLKALDKNPKRRYESVEQFCEDLRRHLEHMPVRACPPSATYRAVKFWRRNRSATVGAACVVTILLLAITVLTREANIAHRRLADVRNLANRFVFDVHDAVKDLPGSTKARKLIVQTGLQYLDSLAADAGGDWNLKRDLSGAYRRIGDVQGNLSGSHLGDVGSALVSYRKSRGLLDALAIHSPGDQETQLNRIVVRRRIGDIIADGKPAEALSVYREALGIGAVLLNRHPNNVDVIQELAGIHLAESETLRLSGDYAGARQAASKAEIMLRDAIAAHPDNQSLQLTRLQSYSALGDVDQMMNDLHEAVDQYRQAAAITDQLLRADPHNRAYLREQMLVYAHVGQVLGYPELPNIGDGPAALKAYRKAVDAARALHEADPADEHALSDEAMMLSHMAAVLPRERTAEKIAIMHQSLTMLREWDRNGPGNIYARVYIGFGQEQLGDALCATGNLSAAAVAYKEGLRYAEALLNQNIPSAVATFLFCARKVGCLEAKAGHRDKALGYAGSALHLAELKAGTGDRTNWRIRARGYAAMGFVLAEIVSSHHAASAQDRVQGRMWLSKTVTAWKAAEHGPGFTTVHRTEMKEAQSTLASLSGFTRK